MALVEIEWRPSPTQLRKFGLSMLIGFAVFALLAEFVIGSRTLALVFAGVGAGTGLLGLTGTKVALPFYWLWMGIAFVMGNIMSRVVIAIFFFGMITTFGVVMRIFGRDKLQRKPKRRASYWCELPNRSDKASYERQF